MLPLGEYMHDGKVRYGTLQKGRNTFLQYRNCLLYSTSILACIFFLIIPVILAICDICYRGNLNAPYRPVAIIMAVLLSVIYCVFHQAKSHEGVEKQQNKVQNTLFYLMLVSGVMLPLGSVIYELCNVVDEKYVNVYKFSVYCVLALCCLSLLSHCIFSRINIADHVDSDNNVNDVSDPGCLSAIQYYCCCSDMGNIMIE